MARPKKKASIVWLGEDHLHEDGNGPSKNVWNGIMFKKGEAVETDNAHMIAKAKANPFFQVDGERPSDDDPVLSIGTDD